MLRKKEKVSFSIVKSDGNTFHYACESSDAAKHASEMLDKIQKNSVRDIIVNVAPPEDGKSGDA